MEGIEVRVLVDGDRVIWEELFRQYAAFYHYGDVDHTVGTTWAWLMDPTHPVEGICATRGGRMRGIAHFRNMPSPLRGGYVGFLDDLFVDETCRGQGCADALIDTLRSFAIEREWLAVRWITREDNYRARGFYDRIAKLTDWKLYEIID